MPFITVCDKPMHLFDNKDIKGLDVFYSTGSSSINGISHSLKETVLVILKAVSNTTFIVKNWLKVVQIILVLKTIKCS